MCGTFPSHSYTKVCHLQCAAEGMQTHMLPAGPCVCLVYTTAWAVDWKQFSSLDFFVYWQLGHRLNPRPCQLKGRLKGTWYNCWSLIKACWVLTENAMTTIQTCVNKIQTEKKVQFLSELFWSNCTWTYMCFFSFSMFSHNNKGVTYIT